METKPQKGRRLLHPVKWPIFGLFYTFLFVSAGVGHCSGATPSPDLLAKATRLVPAQIGTLNVEHPWLSDHTLLYVENNVLYVYDTTTGKGTQLDSLTRQIKTSAKFSIVDAASSDDQVEWYSSEHERYYFASIDGHITRTAARRAKCVWPFWCSDGRHWTSMDFVNSNQPPTAFVERPNWTKAFVYDITRAGGEPSARDIPTTMRQLGIIAVPSPKLVIAFQHPRNVNEPLLALKISEWNLMTGKEIGNRTIHLPKRVTTFAASPDGKRFAWVLYDVNKKLDSLWVSNLDGSDLREIGAVGVSVSSAPISSPCWVPGNKILSFQRGGWLYEVPAP